MIVRKPAEGTRGNPVPRCVSGGAPSGPGWLAEKARCRIPRASPGGRAECCGIRQTIPDPSSLCGCARVTDLGVNVQSLLVREEATRGNPVPLVFPGGRRRGRDGASKRRDAACHGLRPRGQGGMLRYSSHHPGPTSSLRMRPGHGPWCERSIARVGLGVHSPPCGRRTRWSPTAPPEGAGFPWWRAPS